MSELRQIPRASYDKGKDTARTTAIWQAKIIKQNIEVLKKIDEKSKPKGWKVPKFWGMVMKLNNGEYLEMKEYNFMLEFYDTVTSIELKIPDVKNEFYKNRPRNKY